MLSCASYELKYWNTHDDNHSTLFLQWFLLVPQEHLSLQHNPAALHGQPFRWHVFLHVQRSRIEASFV